MRDRPLGGAIMSNTFRNMLFSRFAGRNSKLSDGFNFGKTDILDFDDRSAGAYERRSRIPRKLSKGDWWIVLALYAIVSTFAFVVI